MNIYLLKVNKPFSEYEKYLSYASKERLEKINKLKHDCDKSISLISHLFAKWQISRDLSIPFDNVTLLFNEHGKPYIEKEDYHFSISHSQNIIAFTSHSSPVGIDIQKIDETSSLSAMRFFTEQEKEYIQSSTDRFFEIWTKKEAYLKMLGVGLSKPLSSFNVLSIPSFFSTKIDNFHLSVCTETPLNFNTSIEYV